MNENMGLLTDRHVERQTDKQINEEMDIQTGEQTDVRKDRWMNIGICG